MTSDLKYSVEKRSELIDKLIGELNGLIKLCLSYEKKYEKEIDQVHEEYTLSAINLVHYLAIRTTSLKKLQKELADLGLSRLSTVAMHIMASLVTTRNLLCTLKGEAIEEESISYLSIKDSRKRVKKHAKELFGKRTKKRYTRIMVTQPIEAATDKYMPLRMMEAGMNTIRVNCAHDTQADWLKIINNARQAMETMGRRCAITMDLAGPKIRTGAILPGPKVAHLRPERNTIGQVINPARAALIKENTLFPDEDNIYIPVPAEMLKYLRQDMWINLRDTRDRSRAFKVIKIEEGLAWINCYDTTYVITGTELNLPNGRSFTIGEIPPAEQFLLLKKDDRLYIHKEDKPGKPAQYTQEGELIEMAHVSCTNPEVFSEIRVGVPVVFDDGKIAGKVECVDDKGFVVWITHARDLGIKLKADKGINFPASSLSISGLTDKDREDLGFVVKYADVVNMSFVNRPEDIDLLIEELCKQNAINRLGVILKIETMSGYRNLVDILLRAMQIKPLGVMIARGDLAVECGWDKVGFIQEEIINLCSAAHIPTVWATQVLENLAKKGVPSRAEITDAVRAQQADCVMLNKGLYITKAIEMLDSILKSTESTYDGKKRMLPALEMMVKK